ncbi:MAG: NAD-dependent epimerase/dehydratase family protein, partial [Minisyncoccia bacterium]
GLKTNIIGTFNVLDLASKVGVKRAIIASSSSVYGNLSKKSHEDMATINHTNLYPITKIMNEMTARYFSLRGELETISLRYFNTYGIGENSKGAYSSIIHKFIADMKRGKQPTIYGDGTQRRDFIYIKDVVNANMQAIKNGKSGEVYNVGTGKSLTFNKIYKIIANEIGFRKKPLYIKNPLRSYQFFTQADTSKAEEELRFKAKFDVKSGVRNILKMVAK